MEYRGLKAAGIKLPALTFGTATFGGADGFAAWGSTNEAEAGDLVSMCLDYGVTMFDTANAYSNGLSEEILGTAVAGRRASVLISTKAGSPMGSAPNEQGSSRHTITRACEDSLRRLRTDYVDIYYIHVFDATTPQEETLRALDDLVRGGKIRYIGCSNFSGWHLMKSLTISERYGWSRYVVHQACYSLTSREYEWELMPLALNQGLGTIAWSPLAGGLLARKTTPGKPPPSDTRIAQQDMFPTMCSREKLRDVVEAVYDLALQTGKTMSQVALNWVLQRPTVASAVIGARNRNQLAQNIGAIGWSLDSSQIAKLDAVSEIPPIYPYWHQRWFPTLNPTPIEGHQAPHSG